MGSRGELVEMKHLLIDTDVLIDYLREYSRAVQWLEDRAETLMLSAATVAELHAGVREGRERTALAAFLETFEIVPIDGEIATRGGLFRRDFGKSHGTGIMDALIAATADVRGARLVTLNRKHFPMLKDVLVPYRKKAS